MIFKDLPPASGWQAPAQPVDYEFGSVEPIPFYPSDLPVLDWTDGGFDWQQDELNEACRLARLSLFPNDGATEGLK